MLPADTGLADPRAYVRLAAIVRQQIIDGTLERGQPAPSITRLRVAGVPVIDGGDAPGPPAGHRPAPVPGDRDFDAVDLVLAPLSSEHFDQREAGQVDQRIEKLSGLVPGHDVGRLWS
jgi:hypothetical protein